MELGNDETLEQGLEDINAGQSYRARLLTLVVHAQAGSSAADDFQGRGRGGLNLWEPDVVVVEVVSLVVDPCELHVKGL